MKKQILLFLCFYNSILAFADITPSPVQVKGIVSDKACNIQMVSETVVADIYKDSSFVECTFNMYNDNRADTLEIGFPIMYFYYWQPSFGFERDKEHFEVFENGVKIDYWNIYLPKEMESLRKNPDDYSYYYKYLQNNAKNNEKPWYIWKSSFKKKERKQIKVKYRMPSGHNKMYEFFNYLLSTGAAWKGKIEKAEVIVNLKDISSEQIIDKKPQNYLLNGNQLIWTFKDLEPTINDDIYVSYEKIKGEYKSKEEKQYEGVLWIVDLKKVSSLEFKSLNPNDICRVNVIKDCESATLKKYKAENGIKGGLFVYTNKFVYNKLIELSSKHNPKLSEKLKEIDMHKFVKKFDLQINNKISSNIFGDIFDLESDKIIKIDYKRNFFKPKRLIILTVK